MGLALEIHVVHGYPVGVHFGAFADGPDQVGQLGVAQRALFVQGTNSLGGVFQVALDPRPISDELSVLHRERQRGIGHEPGQVTHPLVHPGPNGGEGVDVPGAHLGHAFIHLCSGLAQRREVGLPWTRAVA